MKQPDSLLKQLFVPVAGTIGLLYVAWGMVRDATAQGGSMSTSMWVGVAVMLVGAVFSAFTAWKRYQQYKLDHAAPVPEELPQEPEIQKATYTVSSGSDLNAAADIFARLVMGNRGLMSQFKKATYSKVFESYCCQLEEGLAHLRLHEEEPDAIAAIADMTMERLVADWKQRNVKAPDFTDQLISAVYLVPTLVYSEEPVAMEFAQAYRESWRQRYPHSVFEIGTYEQVCKGFEKKLGCFITTAVCQAQGKADDCYELTSFRRFRDTWLAQQPGGKAMIEEYYAVAPSIVNLIGLQSNAQDVYRQIRQEYLQPCLKDIEQGNNQSCLARYKGMVEDLRTQYRV